MELSLILPIYNQSDNIKENFPKIYDYLKNNYKSGGFEIIMVDDGSNDDSPALLESLKRFKEVVVISRKANLGRGGAVKIGIPAARGKVIGYIDTDLAVPMHYVKGAVDKVLEGHEVVIGSKYAHGAHYTRTTTRLVISSVSNALIRLFLGSKATDHQCGFKFFDARYIKKAVHDIKDNRWFFDTETLVRAQRNGITPYEVAVIWTEKTRSTFKIKQVTYFFWAIFRMWAGMD